MKVIVIDFVKIFIGLLVVCYWFALGGYVIAPNVPADYWTMPLGLTIITTPVALVIVWVFEAK